MDKKYAGACSRGIPEETLDMGDTKKGGGFFFYC